jgi:hypothetical protein
VSVRVVRFTDVTAERVAGLLARIQESDAPPEGAPITRAVSALPRRPARRSRCKRQEIKRIALSDPQHLGQPFATWSLAKLADYLVA